MKSGRPIYAWPPRESQRGRIIQTKSRASQQVNTSSTLRAQRGWRYKSDADTGRAVQHGPPRLVPRPRRHSRAPRCCGPRNRRKANALSTMQLRLTRTPRLCECPARVSRAASEFCALDAPHSIRIKKRIYRDERPIPTHRPARTSSSKPGHGFADVPILCYRGQRQRLAPDPSRAARTGRRWTFVHRGYCGRGYRPHHARLPRAVFG